MRKLVEQHGELYIDAVILLEANPIQAARIKDGVYADVLGLQEVNRRVGEFVAEAVHRVPVKEGYDWWPTPCFENRADKIRYGWHRLCEDSPYLMADFAECDFVFKPLAARLRDREVTDQQLRDWVVRAVASCGAYHVADNENGYKAINWSEIQRVIRPRRTGFRRPTADEAAMSLPATQEFAPWLSAMTSGPPAEPVQIAAMRFHLINFRKLGATDLDGIEYLRMANHPRFDDDAPTLQSPTSSIHRTRNLNPSGASHKPIRSHIHSTHS
jgi:hypothetical protein